MNISELRRREDLDSLLATTLAAGWEEQHNVAFRVSADASGLHGQQWKSQPLLSAFSTTALCTEGRRFLKDSFRFTPRRVRAPLQWAIGTGLGSRLGLRLLSQSGFRVVPDVPEADRLLIIPGNQRIRMFDFSRGTSRVLQKTGFSLGTFFREIAVRANARGPFIPIERYGANWFEEPLFDGYSLPRCPPWISRRDAEAQAIHLLGEWLSESESSSSADAFVGSVLARIESGASALRSRFCDQAPSNILRAANALAPLALELGRVVTARGHGDFQPGNIMVSRDGQTVRIIDWEHSSVRSSLYDYLVYSLGTRSPAGLGRRVELFLKGKPVLGPWNMAAGEQARRSHLALFLLEDLAWFIEESLTGPFRSASQGLALYQREIERAVLPTLLGAPPSL